VQVPEGEETRIGPDDHRADGRRGHRGDPRADRFPSYEEHLRKGRRAAAQSFLMEVGNREQQYLLDARNYAVGAGALAALNVAVPPEVARFYTVTIDPPAPAVPPSYTVTAMPLAGSPQVPDGALTLTHDGAKTRNGQPGW
jgi:type IV pilus assembly protein PilE